MKENELQSRIQIKMKDGGVVEIVGGGFVESDKALILERALEIAGTQSRLGVPDWSDFESAAKELNPDARILTKDERAKLDIAMAREAFSPEEEANGEIVNRDAEDENEWDSHLARGGVRAAQLEQEAEGRKFHGGQKT